MFPALFEQIVTASVVDADERSQPYYTSDGPP